MYNVDSPILCLETVQEDARLEAEFSRVFNLCSQLREKKKTEVSKTTQRKRTDDPENANVAVQTSFSFDDGVSPAYHSRTSSISAISSPRMVRSQVSALDVDVLQEQLFSSNGSATSATPNGLYENITSARSTVSDSISSISPPKYPSTAIPPLYMTGPAPMRRKPTPPHAVHKFISYEQRQHQSRKPSIDTNELSLSAICM